VAGVLAVAAVAVVAVLLTVGGHHGALFGRPLPTGAGARGGQAAPPAAAVNVAKQFALVEQARENDTADFSSDGYPPDPMRAAYVSVSCQADLTQMATSGPIPPTPQSPRWTMQVPKNNAIRPTTGGRYLLDIVGVDTQTGTTGTGHYYLQQEQNRWVVCGLYKNTEPPSTSNGAPGSGSGAAGGTSIHSTDGGSAITSSDPAVFLNAWAAAVDAGDGNTAVSATCPNSPATGTVQGWIATHAQVQRVAVPSVQGGNAEGDIDLSLPGSATTTQAMWMQQATNGGAWCIRAAAAK
jgi:hypothetical protein